MDDDHLCVWCGKSCGTEDKLIKHQQLQHFKARFTCGLCGNTFANKNARRRHALQQHHLSLNTDEYFKAVASEANKPTADCPKPIATVVSFPCKHCTMVFPLQSVLMDHLIKYHGIHQSSAEFYKDIKPSIKNMALPSEAPISRIFKCRYCSLIFSNRRTRMQHVIGDHGDGHDSTARHNAFNVPAVINAPIVSETTLVQQNQTYQPSDFPVENFNQVIEQNNAECYYNMPTFINAPIKQEPSLTLQDEIYQPLDIPDENYYQVGNIQTPCTMSSVQYQNANPSNVGNDYFYNINPDYDSQKMPICIGNSERTKLKDITVSGTNVVENSFKDTSVNDMNVMNDFVVLTEEISPYHKRAQTSDSATNIPRSYTMNGTHRQDFNTLNVVNPNLNNSNSESSYTSNHAVTHKDVKPIKCPVCNIALFDVKGYKQHIESEEHKSASQIKFKDRINFDTNNVYSNCTCTTVVEFLNGISEDFHTLVKHLLLLNNEILIDLNFIAFFFDHNVISHNPNIVTSKYFCVSNQEVTQDTDLNVLFDSVGKSFISQYDNYLKSNSGLVLDQMVNLEIVVKKSESETNTLKKTEPLQLSKCKICKLFLVQRNYVNHFVSVSHKIALEYSQNQKILINNEIDNLEGCLLNCRFLPKEQISIRVFLSSIKLDFIRLVNRVLELKQNTPVKVFIKLFAIYQTNKVQTTVHNSSIEMFALTNEVLHPNMSVSDWYQYITTSFRRKHQMIMENNRIKCRPCSVICTLYLDIDFYEVETK